MVNYIKNRNRGFTFVEMLIVLSAFSILMTSCFSIFSSTIKTQKYYLATQQLLDQTSFSIDYMGKMLRMAKKEDILDPLNPAGCLSAKDNYSPVQTLPASSSPSIKFIKAESFEGVKAKKCVTFLLSGGKIFQDVSGTQTPITSDNIEITDLKFYISGGAQPPGDTYQPRVTIFLKARAKNMNPAPTIQMQTTISQRDLDVQE